MSIRSDLEQRFGVRTLYADSDLRHPSEIEKMIAVSGGSVRGGRYPGKQRRRQAQGADRRVSARPAMG